MKLTEYILATLVILGIILTYLNFQGSTALITIFLLLLSTFHFLFGSALFNDVNFKHLFKKDFYKQKNITKKKILSAFFLGWSLSIIEVAILFNLLSWPGRKTIMWSGIISTLLFGLIFIFINKENKQLEKTNLIRILIILIISFIVINISPF